MTSIKYKINFIQHLTKSKKENISFQDDHITSSSSPLSSPSISTSLSSIFGSSSDKFAISSNPGPPPPNGSSQESSPISHF